MSENSWNLPGVDAATRQRAAEAADLLGVSLADYLTNVLLQAPPAPALSVSETTAAGPAPGRPRENFAFRHRLEALERRVGVSLGGLEGALRDLDGSVAALAARVNDTEIVSSDAMEAVRYAAADLGVGLVALRQRLADAEDHSGAQLETNEFAHAGFVERLGRLDHHLEFVEDLVHDARQAGAALGEAHDALTRAVAADFSALADETAARVDVGLDEVRADAAAAAAHADAALEQLIEDFRGFREDTEARLVDSAAETRARMQGAFADAGQRLTTLAAHVIEQDHAHTSAADLLRARITAVEGAARSALEAAALGLRHADASLATDMTRLAESNRAALDAARIGLAAEIAGLRGHQVSGQARLGLIDAALESAASEAATLRQTLDARAAEGGRELTQTRRALADDIARVEACTLAALEKLALDISIGDEALARAAEGAALDSAAGREQLARELADLRGQQAGVAARLQLLDRTLGMQELTAGRASPVAARLSQLEGDCHARLERLELALERTETEQALGILRTEIAALGARLDQHSADDAVTRRLEELRSRLAEQESLVNDDAARVHGIARLLSRVAIQSANAASQSEDRLHQLEQALGAARLEHLTAAGEALAGFGAPIEAIKSRLADMEARQAEALEALHAEITLFIDENDRRLAAIEAAGPAAPLLESIKAVLEQRLAEIETRDLDAEFDALRQRVEDRVLDVESRSVRALEQVGETVALIERRFSQGADEAIARSA